jgi:methionine sulfoxide reductase heme-binding subunit
MGWICERITDWEEVMGVVAGSPVESIQQYVRKHWLWLLANVGALIPLTWLGWDLVQGNLSVNPIDDIIDRTGKGALVMLFLSLACTPANILFGFSRALTVRKTLGLYAFFYASFHFLNFVGLDYGFNLSLIFGDALLEKRYILVGLAALIILIPLAITSTSGWIKRLGRNWKRLHQLVYLAGVLAVLHFLWLAKAAERWEPLTYGVILTLLLVVRVPPVRRFFVSLRQRRMPAQKRTTAERKPRPTSTRTA